MHCTHAERMWFSLLMSKVLERYSNLDDPIYAVVAQRKYLPSRVRLFIEHLRAVYAQKGYWD